MSARAWEQAALRVQLPAFPGTRLTEDAAELLAEGLGGVCLFGSNTAGGPAQLAQLTDTIHDLAPDAVVAVDEEGGDVSRLHPGASPVLGPAALGLVDDLSLTRETGWAVGRDLASVGIDLDLGPVADINSDPRNPVIGTRSFGTEPARVAAHVAAWIEGLQSAGVAGCAKHFPGHGDTAADSHLELPLVSAPRDLLEARELVPFQAAVAARVAAVMTSHLLVQALDAAVPATFSRATISLLRDDLGFEGLVVTDALDMAGASAGRGVPEAAVLALLAGADLLCLGADKDVVLVRAVQAALVAAVRDDRLPEHRLLEAAERVAGLRRRTAVASAGEAAHGPTVEGAQLDGARRALRVEGDLPVLAGARVVSIATAANIAVGEVAWGLHPDVVVDPANAESLEGIPAGVPLVVQVRDAHRHAAAGGLLDQIDRSGVPAVVVEWGWPGERRTRLPRICTHGSSLPALAAVTEVLEKAGWTR